MDYAQTLNLPQTDFPMRASLPQREPQILEKWREAGLYEKLMANNEGKPLFVLHDGPPFANGDLHTGHALNKSLKDIIVRFKNMDGFKAPMIHGWDTHGLPIETQAIKKLGINRHEAGAVKFRNVCRDFAKGYMANQMEQIKRLGALGDWGNSYATLEPEFEARQIRVFGEMAKKGYIYRGLKPVYWCPDCETALAEAEIEYAEDRAKSLYVKFQVKDDKGLFTSAGAKKVYFVIWTTTTWTLPANVAVALNPEFEYSLVRANGEYYVFSTELAGAALEAAGIGGYETVKKYRGRELENIVCAHPFLDRDSLVILGDHVTLDAGTGCVHTAPGHGVEDYIVCKKYPRLEIIVPVDGKGVMLPEAGKSAGLPYYKANKVILEELRENGALFAAEDLIHQYPHCWRCNSPIIFRATKQWFASVEGFKAQALEAIAKVKWFPAWGEERISSMVRDRSDWCISRQRLWGVPIPIFFCESCGEPLINDDTINAVSELFAKEGSNGWFAREAMDILPEGAKCSVCGHTRFEKETDTLDGWFDSGSSHAAVLESKKELRWPADIYLEGNDQYRGWFQSSLLTAVATRGEAPYRGVITHGFVVTDKGEKMSKSKGNAISPQDLIKEYGADILRLWVVSTDYKSDVRLSKDIFKQLSEVYRKIRNTARYILGNIYDFNPDLDCVSYGDMAEIDRWALMRCNKMTEKTLAAYRGYEMHMIYHTIHNFCVVDMSNFYLDVIKDRLYTERPDSPARKSAQTAMYLILDSLVRLLAPVLVFTTDEIWQAMPHKKSDRAENVLYNPLPEVSAEYNDAALEEKWGRLLAYKTDVAKALELARAGKVIGASLTARVTLFAKGGDFDFLNSVKSDLAAVFITSSAEVSPNGAPEGAFAGESGISVSVSPAEGEKCERCWMFTDSVGKAAEHPTLCERCAKTLG